MLDPRLDVARHNILRTGPAGRSHVYRRVTVAAILIAVVVAATGTPEAIGLFVLVGGGRRGRPRGSNCAA